METSIYTTRSKREFLKQKEEANKNPSINMVMDDGANRIS